MTINDRFTRGWVAGTCGGLLGGLFGFLPNYIGMSTLSLSDWSAILVFGRVPPFSFFDHLYALGVLAGTTGGIGVLFAFLLPLINEQNIYLRGGFFFLFRGGLSIY